MSFLDVPVEHITLLSPLTPEAAQDRLARTVESPKLLTAPLPTSYLFTGQVSNYCFSLMGISGFGKRGVDANIVGQIHPDQHGSRIEIDMRPVITEYYGELLFGAVCIVGSVAVLWWSISGQLPLSCGLAPLAGLAGFAWLHGKQQPSPSYDRRTLSLLCEIFQAQSAAHQPNTVQRSQQ